MQPTRSAQHLFPRPATPTFLRVCVMVALIGLQVLGGFFAYAVPRVASRLSEWRADHILHQLRDREIPGILRHLGVIPDPPEAVALQVLRALDQRDDRVLHQLAANHTRQLHQQIGDVMAIWPSNVLRRPGAWGQVGPFRSDLWYAQLPYGTTRRIPIEVTYAAGQSTCMVDLQFGARGWQITGLTLK